MDLVEVVYALAKPFPADERFGLTSQLRRVAISILSSIAEGWGRSGGREFKHFLKIARDSLIEVETQLIAAHRFGYLPEAALNEILRNRD